MATKRGPKTGRLANLKSNKSKKIDADQVRGGRKAGKEQQEYLVVKMSDILVSGYQSGPTEGSVP